jgi:undecaprenyl diphosphate synthase
MITEAARRLCRAVAAGTLKAEDVDAKAFEAHLDSSRFLPPLDLLVRTSGEHRISNFFLWEVAYAELFFTEVMWPDFAREHLLVALQDYSGRERRFGQVESESPEEPGFPVYGGPRGKG